MDTDIVKRFICGAKEAYKKVDNHSFNFPITIESAYRLATNIEKLLKEQEAVEPILIREGRNKNYNDYVCPRCDNEVVYEQNYCSECGIPFLWEGR